MAVSDWSPVANSNTAIDGINIAEGCPAGNLNGAIRAIMANVKTFSGATGAQPASPNLTALAELPFVASHIFVMDGPSAVRGSQVNNYMIGLLNTPDAVTLTNAIGAIRVAALSLGDPGYVRLQVGASQFLQIAWGTALVPPGGANILYPANFPNAAFPVIAGGSSTSGSQVNNPYVNAAGIAANGFPVINPRSETVTVSWIAAGY